MARRPWLIGEAPTRANGPPFTGKAAEFLMQVAGYDVHDVFRCTNLLGEWPGPSPSGKGAAFPLLEARDAARTLVSHLRSGDRIVLVGRRTAKAFRMRDECPMFRWHDLYLGTLMTLGPEASEIRFSWIPHPSGVNRWWNSDSNRKHARVFLRSFLDDGDQG